MNFLFAHGETRGSEEQVKKFEGPLYSKTDDLNLEAYGKESIQILLNRHTGDDKVTTWELVDEANGIKVWRGVVKDCDWCPFRAERRINADKHLIERILLDPNRTLELDEMMEGVVTLRNIGDSDRLALRQITSKGQFPIHGREFVVVTYATTLNDGRIVIATRSVNLADVPPLNGHVRAHNHISGYIIQECKDNKGSVYSIVTLVAHADLAGYIPPSIINMLGTSSTVKVLANLETIVTAK
ncbi:MLN, STAR and related lipid-binding proteins [Plasmopara halstedii]|uniref:MLN, STAR and related lipid-binding proteins n=1 Tax=Plasmopara halstedii TaxID=4781 RepID=A0A0N7L8H0_PLAHL|nr:MLN, STAR and related lipid-binding proteins [Plasmopara halstedii]CEG49851.1 MLN, STAR and related lipid-binding proteins [Plasmopara halstedii]|eukprot:XP_024586220.1 MLN, STAR and related lipid-binding proteins [Plasmopara halstedii]